MKYPSVVSHFTAVMLIIFVLAALFFAAIALARRSGNPFVMMIARVVFILVLTIPVNGVLSNYSLSVQNSLFIPLIGLVLLALLLLVIIYRKKFQGKLKDDVFSFLKNTLLIMSAFLLFNIFNTAWQLIRMDPITFNDKQPAGTQSTGNLSHPRVLLLIFDEMSQDITFDTRPAGLELPELDRFKNQAVYANNAYPPGGETDISLPSIITGRIVPNFKPVKPDELMITLDGENLPVGWSTIPNIFSQAYELGINTSVVGWYHPYGRLFGDSMKGCSWHPYEPYRQMSFAESLTVQAENLVDIIPLGKHLRLSSNVIASDLLIQEERHQTYLKILAETKTALNDPDNGLIMVHWPVPHPPGLYDRSKNEILLNGGSYLDNLALTDQTLGVLRQYMEDMGAWEKTTVIITSDHWWRKDLWRSKLLWTAEDETTSLNNGNDWRVPFLIKMAVQNEAVYYDQEFNTIVIHDLVLALLNNEFSGPEEVVNWINVNKSIYPIPEYCSSDM
jgi:hypothetical protein